MNILTFNFHAFLQLHKGAHLHTSFQQALQNVYVVERLLHRLTYLLSNITVYTVPIRCCQTR